MLENVSIKPFYRYKNKYFYIFSASGFEDSLKEIEDKNLHLIDLKTMFEQNKWLDLLKLGLFFLICRTLKKDLY